MSTRRIMLLAILALALPTAALANTISFSSSSFEGVGSLGESLGLFATVEETPFNPYDISIFSANVFQTGPDTFNFIGGTVEVDSMFLGQHFQFPVMGGDVSEHHMGTFIVLSGAGSLEPNARIKNGSFSFLIGNGDPEFMSSFFVSATTVPEPGSLEGLLLGTGLLGLVEMARRKLQLGT